MPLLTCVTSADEERDRSRSRRSKSSRRRKSRKYSSESETDSEEEYERERRRRRRREREKEKERARDKDRAARSTSLADGDDSRAGASRSRGGRDDDGWVEKENRAERREAPAVAREHSPVEGDDADEVGPQPPSELKLKDKFNREAYRGLLPGEGAGMQQFVERGERIPRRGEIGLDSDRIAQFEESGYVMSGNRHARMNAVRLRKEGQVINAEEKRALLIMQREEKQRKEGAIVTQFKEMMDERLKLEERRQRERDEHKEQ
ncbi:hypothetical protein Q8F55_005060 [Vanrija albida]|uniref:NF-kappa-B-activating protein C-terminal domain-containing protein n=1 Tax=Vanrija albida TaxID=181172 RepID=A0ABR3Q0M0_9TREE